MKLRDMTHEELLTAHRKSIFDTVKAIVKGETISGNKDSRTTQIEREMFKRLNHANSNPNRWWPTTTTKKDS